MFKTKATVSLFISWPANYSMVSVSTAIEDLLVMQNEWSHNEICIELRLD